MHPFQAHKAHKVEHSRVAKITKGYATGGVVSSVGTTGGPISKKAVSQRDAQAVSGRPAQQRLDRPTRARGGRTGKHHKGTHVNVIVAPQGGGPGHLPPPTGPAPMAGVAPPMMPPRPPVAMPPQGAGMLPPGAGMPPPGAMPPPGLRSHGGRAYARGGAVKSGPAWNEGLKAGTQVQHTPNKMDGPNIGRPKVITYKKGGRVKRDDGGPIYTSGSPGPGAQDTHQMLDSLDKQGVDMSNLSKFKENSAAAAAQWAKTHQSKKTGGRVKRATGGKVEADQKGMGGNKVDAPGPGKGMAPKLPGGGGGGKARLVKAHAKHDGYRL